MNITILCNAGLAIEYNGEVLLVDVPNENVPPFTEIQENTWADIVQGLPPFHNVCGLWFSHTHGDHYCREKVNRYKVNWPQTPVFIPEEHKQAGRNKLGPFLIEYMRVEHAPIPNAPAHVVTWIEVGGKAIYISSDAELNCDAHRAFLQSRKANAAFWNSMYLSHTETRELLREAADTNYIYHMPADRKMGQAYWSKLHRNYEKFQDELINVVVVERYPSVIMV